MTLSSVPALTSSANPLPGHGDSMAASSDDQNCDHASPSKKRRLDNNTIANDMKQLVETDGNDAEIALVLQYDELVSRQHMCSILLNLEDTMTDREANELHARSAF